MQKVTHKSFLIFIGVILFLIGYFLKSMKDFVLDSQNPSFHDVKFEFFEDSAKPPVVWPSSLSESTCLKVTIREIKNRKILGDELKIVWYPENGGYRVESLDEKGRPSSVSSRSVVRD